MVEKMRHISMPGRIIIAILAMWVTYAFLSPSVPNVPSEPKYIPVTVAPMMIRPSIIDENADTDLVIEGATAIGADNHHIKVTHRANATNVSYRELYNFILKDETDKIPYKIGVFTCGDYAERLQRNAELAGIECGYVSIDFMEGGPGHMINVFNTTDRGIVYIDCTTGDFIVNKIEKGYKYLPMFINPSISPDGSYTVTLPTGIVKSYSVAWS